MSSIWKLSFVSGLAIVRESTYFNQLQGEPGQTSYRVNQDKPVTRLTRPNQLQGEPGQTSYRVNQDKQKILFSFWAGTKDLRSIT